MTVLNGEVSLVCTTFEFADDIDIKRAKAAKEKLEAELGKSVGPDAEAILKAKLARALSRIDVWEMGR